MSWTVKTYNGTSETTRTPFYPSINFTYNRVEDQVYYRRECTTSFRFTGDDYTYFKNLLDTNYCGTLELRLYWDASLKYTGQIRIRSNSEWDFDNCKVDITASPKDDYNELFANWEEETNILSSLGGVSLIEVSSLAGTIETTTVETEGAGPPNDPPGPASETWVVINSVTEESAINQIWARETITVACSGGVPVSPGDDWTLAENNCPTDARYVRPVETYLILQTDTYDFQYGIVGVDTGNTAETYDNGRLWNEIIEYLADQAGFTVVSDFFNINADATAPSNDAYTAANPNMQNLGIFQKSDITRFDAAQNATILNVSLKELLELCSEMLDMKFSVDGTEIRIEHITYFTQSNGEDLTSTFPNNIEDTDKFSFVESDDYPREKFFWADEDPKSGLDFRGRDIIYDCANEENDPKIVRIGQVSTDFSAMQSNPEAYADEGFVLLSLGVNGSDYYIRTDQGELTGLYSLNAHLSWANIHENYKQDERPQPTGNLNLTNVTFNSTKPRKRQIPITIYKSVTDYFSWDPSENMKTNLGWGRVESSEYNSKTCKLTITLLYD